MARYGNYSWSPRQMDRINERRAKRGQEELRNRRYEDDVEEDRQSPSSRPMPIPVSGEMEDISLKDRQAAKTAEFRKQFSPAGSMQEESETRTADFKKSFNKSPSSLNQPSSMASRRAIADEEFRKKFGKGKNGISTPMTKSAMERVMGTA